jgi:hypothetical protein
MDLRIDFMKKINFLTPKTSLVAITATSMTLIIALSLNIINLKNENKLLKTQILTSNQTNKTIKKSNIVKNPSNLGFLDTDSAKLIGFGLTVFSGITGLVYINDYYQSQKQKNSQTILLDENLSESDRVEAIQVKSEIIQKILVTTCPKELNNYVKMIKN